MLPPNLIPRVEALKKIPVRRSHPASSACLQFLDYYKVGNFGENTKICIIESVDGSKNGLQMEQVAGTCKQDNKHGRIVAQSS